MGRWTWEWSSADPTQCWMEVLQLWQSEGFKTSMFSHRSGMDICSAAEGHPEFAEAKPINHTTPNSVQLSC